MAHIHDIVDDDIFIDINPESRQILIDTPVKLVQHDHNCERITFRIPRMIDGHDFKTCDVIEIHYTNTSAGTSVSSRASISDVYSVEDLKIYDKDRNYVTFSWLISGNATVYAGVTRFKIMFACYKEDSTEHAWRWNTDICSSIEVSAGFNNESVGVTMYPDVLASYDKRLDEHDVKFDDTAISLEFNSIADMNAHIDSKAITDRVSGISADPYSPHNYYILMSSDADDGHSESPNLSYVSVTYLSGDTYIYDYHSSGKQIEPRCINGRYYAIVPLESYGNSVASVTGYFEYYTGGGPGGYTTSKLLTFSVISTEDLSILYDDWSTQGEVTWQIDEDDEVLSDLVKVIYSIPNNTNFYVHTTEGYKFYRWNGEKAQPLEAPNVNLNNYADKDFVAKNYVPNATRQGIYAYDFIEKDENGNRIYGNKTINYSSDADTTGWRIVQRDGYGFINAKDPEDYNHVANKGYVDFSLIEVKNGLQSILDVINNMM